MFGIECIKQQIEEIKVQLESLKNPSCVACEQILETIKNQINWEMTGFRERMEEKLDEKIKKLIETCKKTPTTNPEKKKK